MDRHHSSSITILGIAVIAGFLLILPALAAPITGMPTMGSAQSLMLSMQGFASAPLLTANDTDSSSSPVAEEPEEAAPDEISAHPDDDLVEEIPEPTFEPEPVETEPTTSLPDEEPLDWVGGYDDEQLDSLISSTSIRLMTLSMRHAHALYLQDTGAATAAADELHGLAADTLTEAQPLRISPERQEVQQQFIRSLEAYAAVSEALAGMAGADTRDMSPLLRELEGASKDLETVQQQVEITPVYIERTQEVTARSPAVRTSAATVAAGPERTLMLQERHAYDDPYGENMVSLIVDSTRNATGYRIISDGESEQTVEADEGEMFLLVAVRATNLGHKGNSDLYDIETPDRSAFTLHYQDFEYAPLDMPRFTSLGESYDRRTLERYASVKGYLFFDVPKTMNISEARLSADLGSAGAPVWNIGTGL